MTKIRITVLVENTAGGPDLLAEHGLAYWIEYQGRRVLFDCGQGGVLASNAYKLRVPLREIDALVLSHGHYDHTGGVAEALKSTKSIPVYAHQAAFARKFMRNRDGTAREIGLPYFSDKAIRESSGRWIPISQPTTVFAAAKGDSPHLPERPEGCCAQMGTVPFCREGLRTTGPVPRLVDFEDPGGPFFLDEACTQPDPLEDDQSLFFDTAAGIVVLLGCAHSGIINTLRYVGQLAGHRPIRAVIGGMHLIAASPERITRTIEELQRIGVERLAPAHCTGMPATVALWNAFPDRCLTCHTGSSFEFTAE